MGSRPKVTKLRSNKAQINYLWDYMEKHKDFAYCDYKQTANTLAMEGQWVKLREELNQLGPKRSLEQWKVCWRDQKRKGRNGTSAPKPSNSANNTSNINVTLELTDDSVLAVEEIVKEEPDSEPEESIWVAQPSPPQARASSSSSSASEGPQPDPLTAPSRIPLAERAERQPTRRPLLRRRVHVNHLPNRLLNTQIELNGLIRELVKEVRRSNILREQHNQILMKKLRRNRF